jgi:uncharacterized membrane protein
MANVIVKDKHWRSVVKAVSWRITGTVDTILISWLITHKMHMALAIGSVELFTKMVLYYFHERLWERVKVGRALVDYEI